MEVLALGFIVFIVALFVWAVSSSNKRGQMWQKAAPTLGLGFHAGPHSQRYIHARRHLPEMYGQHDGQDVYVGVRSYTTGSGKNRTTHYFTYVDVVFDVALKRGLQVNRAGGVSKFFGAIFGQLDIQVGHEAFDRDFRIKAIEPGQAQALLARPDLIAMLQADYGAFEPSINDQRVRIEAKGVYVDAAVIGPLLPAAVALYRGVLDAWHSLPPSAQEQHAAPAWQRVAERSELTYWARGMVATGRAGSVHVRAEVTLDKNDGWHTYIQAAFDPPLGVGLGLAREGVMAGLSKLFGSQDIQVGDKAFDATFVVKGKDPQKVLEILVPEAREALLALQRDTTHELLVTDDHVRIDSRGIVDDGDRLEGLITQVTGAAEAMVSHRRPKPTSPYR